MHSVLTGRMVLQLRQNEHKERGDRFAEFTTIPIPLEFAPNTAGDDF
jgi:hypothetical protein